MTPSNFPFSRIGRARGRSTRRNFAEDRLGDEDAVGAVPFQVREVGSVRDVHKRYRLAVEVVGPHHAVGADQRRPVDRPPAPGPERRTASRMKASSPALMTEARRWRRVSSAIVRVSEACSACVRASACARLAALRSLAASASRTCWKAIDQASAITRREMSRNGSQACPQAPASAWGGRLRVSGRTQVRARRRGRSSACWCRPACRSARRS